MTKHRIWPFLSVLVALAPLCASISAISPVWVASSYFKAGTNCIYLGGVTFTYSAGVTNQNLTVSYSAAMVNPTLKVPTLGITDLNYNIVSGVVYLYIQVVKYTSTYLTFNVDVNQNLYLSTLKLTYMALDNSFTPAFSMNYFFPVRLHIFRTLREMGPTSITKPSSILRPQRGLYSTPATRTFYFRFCTT